jgi:hypothetical protein
VVFIRFKGPYAYLVGNERRKVGAKSYVRQRVLYYLGREPVINDDVVAEVEGRFPELSVDWRALRETLARGREPTEKTATRKRVRKAAAARRRDREDEWLDWD